MTEYRIASVWSPMQDDPDKRPIMGIIVGKSHRLTHIRLSAIEVISLSSQFNDILAKAYRESTRFMGTP
jgi:hypothetical protein